MNKSLFTIAFVVGSLPQLQAQQKSTMSQLSPQTQQYLLQAKVAGERPQEGYVYRKGANGQLYISALIKAGPAVDETTLQQLGASIGTKAGNIWTVQVPVARVAAFTQVSGIEYIQLDEPVAPAMDSVRRVTHVDSVHAGINLPMAFTGKNVVMGMIDVGFDYSHPLFFDTLGTGFRIKKVWQQKTPGTPPAGFAYGSELTTSAAMWAAGTDIATQSHGTHVAGIAAGSGIGSSTDGTRFRGMAFGTDVVLVGITPPQDQWMNTGLADIIDGINYTYQYAASVGKPAVANLSWGCSIGSHDGLSLFSQACDNLTGPGRLFVCSAGNTGSDRIHVQKTFTVTDTMVRTFVGFDSYLGAKKTWVDIWGDTAKTFCVAATLYNGTTAGNTTGPVCLDNNTHNLYLLGASGDTCYLTITTAAAAGFNGKPRILLNINSKTADGLLLTVKGTSGKVNIWEGYVQNSTGYYGELTNNGMSGVVNGDMDYTVSDFSTTKSAISVGAYATKNIFVNVAGGTVDYRTYVARGRIVPFSSHGPSADNRILPVITAPGFIVASGINSYDTSFAPGGSNANNTFSTFQKNGRDYSYAMLSGTSMSSPVVSGVVALLLEANPALTPQQVQTILAETAITDVSTGAIPPAGTNRWGHGKVNAYAAIRRVVHDLGIDNRIGRNMRWSVFPNPNKGDYQLECTTDKAETATIELTDLSGKVLLRESWRLVSGTNTRTLHTGDLAKGMYLTRIIATQGQSAVKTLIE